MDSCLGGDRNRHRNEGRSSTVIPLLDNRFVCSWIDRKSSLDSASILSIEQLVVTYIPMDATPLEQVLVVAVAA